MRGRLTKDVLYYAEPILAGTEFVLATEAEAAEFVTGRDEYMAAAMRDELAHGGTVGHLAGKLRLIDRGTWEEVGP